MKYLDRSDALEIIPIGLLVIGVLLIVTGLILLIYAVTHITPSGCIPYVTI